MSEQLRIVIGFSANWWKNPAEYGIYLNGQCLERSTANKVFEPISKVVGGQAQHGWNELKFRLEKKTAEDMLRADDGTVIRNTYLNLNKIVINDVGYPQHELLRLNGAWYKDSDIVNPIKGFIIYEPGSFVFKFKSPVAYWHLENCNLNL